MTTKLKVGQEVLTPISMRPGKILKITEQERESSGPEFRTQTIFLIELQFPWLRKAEFKRVEIWFTEYELGGAVS